MRDPKRGDEEVASWLAHITHNYGSIVNGSAYRPRWIVRIQGQENLAPIAKPSIHSELDGRQEFACDKLRGDRYISKNRWLERWVWVPISFAKQQNHAKMRDTYFEKSYQYCFNYDRISCPSCSRVPHHTGEGWWGDCLHAANQLWTWETR